MGEYQESRHDGVGIRVAMHVKDHHCLACTCTYRKTTGDLRGNLAGSSIATLAVTLSLNGLHNPVCNPSGVGS